MREEVIKLIEKFLKENTRIFFNENEFQRCLACYLEKNLGDGYDIYTEYQLKLKGAKPQIYDTNQICDTEENADKKHTISIDIVVVKDNTQFMPIELKYKTKETTVDGHLVFNTYQKVITNQMLVNSGRVAYWMDVQRIEQIKIQYPNSVLGVAVILSNKDGYWVNSTTSDVSFCNFSLHSGRRLNTGELLEWHEDGNRKPVNCVVSILRDTDIHWRTTSQDFKYLLLPNKKLR